MIFFIPTLFILINILSVNSTNTNELIEKIDVEYPVVKININSFETIYEGDIINCSISGNPTLKYWMINNQKPHTTFIGDKPVIFDPDPTPMNDTYVNLTVYVENLAGNSSDTVTVKIKRLFFGDIHFHSKISDGYHDADTLYQNAIIDNYLDFACLTDHAEIINSLDFTPPQPIWMRIRSLLQFFMYKFFDIDQWQIIKNKANEYYMSVNFTTLLGFEYSPSAWYPGGSPLSPNGHMDTCHINFYYRDVYPDAPKYSAWEKHTYDDIFKAMAEEYDKGHLNIGFPHHPLMTMGVGGSVSINWSFLANKLEYPNARDKVMRGVETYSIWGTAIGKYSDIPVNWPYRPLSSCDKPVYWVENALWEFSKNQTKNQRFALMASSDNHAVDRPGSVNVDTRISKGDSKPSGIIAAYAVHNTRSEIWDAMNDCSIYGLQALKIRANVRFNNEMALGKWINCTSPLNIQITTYSTFPGQDRSGKNMNPNGYSPDELDYPINDIWLVKKDSKRGQPWCKVIGHATPNTNLAIVDFWDYEVQPNDFYFVVIKQKGQSLEINKSGDTTKDEYMAFIGPVFINNVI